jgi:hypothetical protein
VTLQSVDDIVGAPFARRLRWLAESGKGVGRGTSIAGQGKSCLGVGFVDGGKVLKNSHRGKLRKARYFDYHVVVPCGCGEGIIRTPIYEMPLPLLATSRVLVAEVED